MNCGSCGGAVQLAPSGSIGRCGACGAWMGVTSGGPIALALSEPWPSRTRDEIESEREDRAFDAAANAPNPTGNLLRILIPAIVVVIMLVVGASIFLNAQSSAPSSATPTSPKTPAAAPPPTKKK